MGDHHVDSLGHLLRMKLMTADDKLRDWALRGQHLEGLMRVSFARTACMLARNAAERDGREFTPIYWYFVDMDTPPVMTLWDMNER